MDRGYKGHGIPEERSRVLISGTRRLGYRLKRHLRRRSAVEPEIGHLKADGRLGRNFLKGMEGDAVNGSSAASGNLRKILARLRALLYLLPSRGSSRPSSPTRSPSASLNRPRRPPDMAKGVQGRLVRRYTTRAHNMRKSQKILSLKQ